MANPLVSVIMGSDSDLPVMNEAVEMLEHFGIPHEVTIVSAHRTPDRLHDYAHQAEGRGIRVVIAGAGGAAHLPGMVASVSPVPVIGVPVKSKTLSGIDSLYSIVQMPPGIPVATMAINGAKNAGIMAAEILGAGNDEIRTKVQRYKHELADSIVHKATKLEQIGHEKYLEGMDG